MLPVSQVFGRVQRLVRAFLDLHSAGNLLFRSWAAKVYCSPRGDVSICVDFGLALGEQLVGGGDVLEQLEAVCRPLEHCLQLWEDFVAQKRLEHFYLNFYTAEQLVYLSHELRKATPSQAALTMLSFLKKDCTPAEVLWATSGSELEAAEHLASITAERVAEELPRALAAEDSLGGQLRVFLEQAMGCMTAFLPHCLDLQALGSCLARLACVGGPRVQRHLPQGLQVGRPNLVLCDQAEVLLATLAVYMQAPEQPLPSYDEVLLCTPATTLEEVALLLRRCLTLGSRSRKVYCLLFGDQLSYEVACRAGALFHSLCAGPHREDYQLVLLCDRERGHCCLPSAFSQDKVLVTPQAPLQAVQAYLAQHFRVSEQTCSAATVFKDQMCVGIVASERAGVGNEGQCPAEGDIEVAGVVGTGSVVGPTGSSQASGGHSPSVAQTGQLPWPLLPALPSRHLWNTWFCTHSAPFLVLTVTGGGGEAVLGTGALTHLGTQWSPSNLAPGPCHIPC